MSVRLLKRWLVGPPMPLAQARHERLHKRVALAVFSSDAMSSVAYATEEILLVLVLAGAAAAHLSVPIALAITALLIVVVVSYQQTIHAYPSGGGSYIVARANLGTLPGLVAAAALLVDYVLTVAVSVAAGVAAITSAVPEWSRHKVVIGIFCVAAIALANIRGVRESGRIFAVPDVCLHRQLPAAPRRRGVAVADRLAAAGGTASGGGHGAAGVVPRSARVRLRLHGHDRHRGDLQRHPGLPARPSPATRRSRSDGWRPSSARSSSALPRWPRRWACCRPPTETVVSQIARRLFGGGSSTT